MMSPRTVLACLLCEGALLEPRRRHGVWVEFCGSCRGTWLDDGSLERILGRVLAEHDAMERCAQMRRDYPGDGRFPVHGAVELAEARGGRRKWFNALAALFG